MLLDHTGEFVGGVVEGAVPAHAGARTCTVGAEFGIEGAQRQGFRRGGQVQGRTFGTQTAEVGRMVGIATYAGDLSGFVFDDDAAAYAAVTAGGFCISHDSFMG